MSPIISILAVTVAITLLSFIGMIFLGLADKVLKRILDAMVAFAIGSLLGGAFLHLLPHSISENGTSIFNFVIVGLISFFIVERFLKWRHCHREPCEMHTFGHMNLIGDGIHNFLDGAIIAVGFIANPSLGTATSLAIIAHEIPQEIGDFGVLLTAGFTKRKALVLNCIAASTVISGGIITFFLSSHVQAIVPFLTPFSAGGFIYMAGTDLIPELHKRAGTESSIVHLAFITLGLIFMWSLTLFNL